MASFTKKAIRETFLKLLREKPVSRISICEIVETCGINRNTFYYYYQDLPELIEEILIEETEKAVSQFNDINSIEECVELLEGEIMKNKKPILHLHQSSVSNRVFHERYLRKVCEHFVSSFFKNVLAELELSEKDKHTLIHFYECACFGYLIEWLDNGMKSDITADFYALSELKQNMNPEFFRRAFQRNSDN